MAEKNNGYAKKKGMRHSRAPRMSEWDNGWLSKWMNEWVIEWVSEWISGDHHMVF